MALVPPAHAVGEVTVICERPAGVPVVTWNYNPVPNATMFNYNTCDMITTTLYLTGLGTDNFSDQPSMTTFDGSASTSITSLPARLFSGDSSLTNVILPPNIMSIGEWAFQGTGFTSFTVPPGVTSLPNYLFDSANLRSITMHAGVTSIGEYAFYRSRIESIDLPDGLTTIPVGAFNQAGYLTSVDLPANLSSIGVQAFRWTALTGTLTMPSGVTDIGLEAFLDSHLSTIVLNSGLQTIGERAFAGLPNLAGTLSIPASVTSLGDNIVDNASSDLRELTFLGNKPTMSPNAFSSLDASNPASPRLTFTTGTSGWGDSGICGETVTVSNYPFTGICIPTITSISPSWVPVEGAPITIAGANFMPGATVSIGGVDLTDASVTSSTTITATAPAFPAGTRALSVTNEGLRTSSISLGYGPPGQGGGQASSSATPSVSATTEPEATAPPRTQEPVVVVKSPAPLQDLKVTPAPGQAIALVDGRRVPVEISSSERTNSVNVRGVTWKMGFTCRTAKGRALPVRDDDALIVRPGCRLSVTGAGSEPNLVVSTWIRSSTKNLGTVAARANGRFATTVTVPRHIKAGGHTIIVTMYRNGGQPLQLALGVVAEP